MDFLADSDQTGKIKNVFLKKNNMKQKVSVSDDTGQSCQEDGKHDNLTGGSDLRKLFNVRPNNFKNQKAETKDVNPPGFGIIIKKPLDNLKRKREAVCQSDNRKTLSEDKKKEVMNLTIKHNESVSAGPHRDKEYVIFDSKLSDVVIDACLRGNCEMVDSGTTRQVFKVLNKDGEIIYSKKMTCKVNYNEVIVPAELAYEGIVRMLGVAVKDRAYYVFMEYAGRPLRSLLADDAKFKSYISISRNLCEFSTSLYRICAWLEKHHAVNRDVKPENITAVWRDGRYWPILLDFGSAQTTQDKPEFQSHTPEYLPPGLAKLMIDVSDQKGVLKDEFFKESSDLYGMSMTILYLYLGKHPFNQVSEYTAKSVVQQRSQVRAMIADMPDGFFDPLLSRIQEPLRTVLANTLCLDPEKRWSAKRVYEFMAASTDVDSVKKSRPSEEHTTSPQQEVTKEPLLIGGIKMKQRKDNVPDFAQIDKQRPPATASRLNPKPKKECWGPAQPNGSVPNFAMIEGVD